MERIAPLVALAGLMCGCCCDKVATTPHSVAEIPESTAFTAMAWVNASSGSSVENPYPRILELPFGRLLLVGCEGFADAGNVLFELPHSSDPDDFSRWTYTTAVPFGRWAHVALVCRGADEGRPELYVNGKRAKSYQTAKRLARTFAGGEAVVGNASVGGKSPLPGRVADFRFEPRALSPDELASAAAATPDGAPPVDWRFEGHDELPLVDISGEASRQAVIASGADGVYQGHPTTAVAPDGTVYCVWTIGHGGACGPMAKSVDGGRTWTRCDGIMPEEYRTKHFNCPTLQRIVRRDGGTNLAVFSSVTGGCGIVVSEDSGRTWRVAPDAKLPAMMPPTGLVMLKGGSVALFGQIRKPGTVPGDTAVSDQAIWMSVSKDGGWTWGEPRIVAEAKDRNLCEPFAFRSPDGNELCLLIRDNRHKGRSMMSFSRDEGRTWTEPADTCWGLTGDRHEGVRLPDGRLFIAFRDRAIGSSTYGQYVAWVGSYADLRAGRPGDFRVHLLEHVGERIWDTGYSGVECLADGTVLCTTYLHYRESDRAHSVVCTRFNLAGLAPLSSLGD